MYVMNHPAIMAVTAKIIEMVISLERSIFLILLPLMAYVKGYSLSYFTVPVQEFTSNSHYR